MNQPPKFASQTLLVILFLAGTYMKVVAEFDILLEGPALVHAVIGFRTIDEIAELCAFVSVGMITLLVLLLYHQARLDQRTQMLLLRRTKQPPQLSLRPEHTYHLFLSHIWSSGQDQMAVMKRSLQRLLPGSAIFLDVDDLEDIGDLESYVKRSSRVLIFLSKGYFQSRNCLREARAVVARGKPISLCWESDVNKGGLSLEASMAECPKQMRPFIFADEHGTSRPIVTWHRIRPFQVSLPLPFSPHGATHNPFFLHMTRLSCSIAYTALQPQDRRVGSPQVIAAVLSRLRPR